MRKLLLLLLAILLLSLLAACDPAMTKGYVYDKQYTPGHYHYDPGYSTTTCSKVGKPSGPQRSTICRSTYHPGFSYWVSASYELELTTCSSLQTDGQCQTGWVYVGEGAYNTYRVGSYYGGN